MIYTFYSFKGGVGRSMALANIAELLYSRGLKVLMVDFDLEAPGLERYFDVPKATKLTEILTQRGVIDLLLSYKELRSLPKLQLPKTNLPETAQATDGEADPNQQDFPFSVEPLDNFIVPIYPTSVTGASLSLLPAGRRAKKDDASGRDGGVKNEFVKYAERVRSFNWDDFYANWDGEQFFEWFRKEAENLAEVVLIDSRTGVTEMSGVCTYQLADVVALFVAANNQNIAGTKMMADNLSDPLLVSEGRKGRSLSLVFVPSRVEPFESHMLEEFQKDFQEHFGNLILKSELKFENTAFLDLMIPYSPGYAFKEDVAAREPSRPNANQLVRSFDKIATTLAQLEPKSSRLRRIFYPIERANIFLSYEKGVELDDAIAKQLAEALGKQHYVFLDQMSQPGDNSPEHVASEINKVDFLIILLSAESIRSKRVNVELTTAYHLAEEQGRPAIFPVRLNYQEPLPSVFGKYLNHIHQFSWGSPDDTPRLIEELLRSITLAGEPTISVGGLAEPAQDKELLESNFLLWRQELRLSVEKWKSSRDDDDLLRGFALVEASNYLVGRRNDLNQEDQEYIMASLARQKQVRQSRPALSEVEGVKAFPANPSYQILRNSLRTNPQPRFKIGVITALVAAVLGSGYPLVSYLLNAKPKQLDPRVISRALAENSLSQLSSDPQLSLLLAIQSVDAASTDEAKNALRQSLYGLRAKVEDIPIVLDSHVSTVKTAEFSPNGKLVVTSSADGAACVWDSLTGSKRAKLTKHGVPLISAVFSTDGQHIVTAGRDGNAWVWDVNTAKEVAGLRDHKSWVVSARFSPDGQSVVTSSFDNTARIWDWASGKQKAVLQHDRNVYSAEFDDRGQFVVTASEDGTARIWDAGNGQKVFTLEHPAPLRYAVFSPDGSKIVTACTDNTARLWDSRTGHLVAKLEGHSDWVTYASFSPDGRLVASASNDGTARVWSASTGENVAVVRGHSNWVKTVEFDPDSKSIVTASRDNTARVWDSATGAPIAVLEGHWAAVNTARFNRDGSFIVTASNDSTARIFSCKLCGPIEELVAVARKNVAREFTAEERQKYSLTAAQ